MDIISIFVFNIRRYFFTAIDMSIRFASARAYTSNPSTHSNDLLKKFIAGFSLNAMRIQTDNGGKFEKHFEKSCQ